MANVSSSNGLEKRPKLRFPGFDKPWKVFKAEELFQNITDKNHPDETVLTIIQGKGTLPREQAGRNIHYDDASLSNYKKVEQGDFIIHLRSFEGGLEMANEAGIVSPAYTILRCKRPHSSLFYDAYFHTDEFINHNLSKSVEGIRDGRQISYEAFKWLGIPYCEPTEQEKISNLFAALNERIAKQRDLIEALKKYKRGLNKLVFEKITSGAKQQIPLSELCESISSGRTTSSNADGIFPLFGSTGVVGKTNIIEFDGDIVLIARVGANAGKVNYFSGQCAVTDNTLVIRVKENLVQAKFLAFFLEYYNLHRLIFGSGQPLVTGGQLKKIKMPLVSLTTQVSLTQRLEALDSIIEVHEKYAQSLTLLKSGLMQQLFI